MSAKKKVSKTTTAEKPQSVAASETSGNNMVTVAFNSPRGIIFSLGKREVHVNGNASHLAGQEKGIIPVGRYGYTRLSAADWAAIEKVYGGMEIFKNGLIFAEKSKDRAEDKADEMRETRHGQEPVDVSATATEEAVGEGA